MHLPIGCGPAHWNESGYRSSRGAQHSQEQTTGPCQTEPLDSSLHSIIASYQGFGNPPLIPHEVRRATFEAASVKRIKTEL